MARYIASQFGRFLLLMAAVAVVTFALVSLSPVDPLQANVGQAALLSMSEEKRAALAAYWGADTPMFERFLAWAGDLLHGDLGMSLRYNAPVAEVIASRAANSLALMGVAWVVSGVLGFALGMAAALREGRLLDRFVRGYCFVLAASPTFWVGLLLLMVFSVWARVVPPRILGARWRLRCRRHLRRCAASHGAAGHHAIGGGGGQRGAAHPGQGH